MLKTAERPAAWRVNECLIDLASQNDYAEGCIERARPLVVVWGDSTAGALMPGLRELQSKRSFGLAQFTANSCEPLISSAVSPACRANNERVRHLVAAERPDIVVLAGFGPLNAAAKAGWSATLAALKTVPRIVVVGPVPSWKRGVPEQALSYYVTHRKRMPERSRSQVHNLWDDRDAGAFFAARGAQYISAWDRFCNADGCLTRIDQHTLSATDGTHLTEKASAFFINLNGDDILHADITGGDAQNDQAREKTERDRSCR